MCDVSTNFYDLSEDQQAFLLNWIKENFIPAKTINLKHTAYGIKQHFTSSYFYVSQEQFTTAMVKAGFKSQKLDSNSGNCSFNIGENSPYLKA